MRKSNSTDICDDFRQEIDDLLSFRTALLAGNVSKANQSLLAELVFHRGYVALESFLSAWFLSCINRDSTQFLSNRQQKIRDAITEQFGAWDNGKIAYSPPAHISVADLSDLLDPDGKNITFYSYDDLKKKSNKWLATTYQAKVNSLAYPIPKIYTAAKAIRNCIAHQSKSSFDTMNSVLSALPNHQQCRQLRNNANSVRNVGSHLKAVFGGKTRTEIYLEGFKYIGQKLR